MISINTEEFEQTHKRQPRGYGQWLFEINGESFVSIGKYSVAKEDAIKLAVSRKVTEVTLLP